MNLFQSLDSAKPTPQQGAVRIKRILNQTFHQIETNLSLVRQITERHSRSKIDNNLGKDRDQVVKLYGVLKAMVEQNKPGTKIPDLPM